MFLAKLTHHMGTLKWKTAAVADQLSEFQQPFQEHIIDEPLTFTPAILSSVDSTITTKL